MGKARSILGSADSRPRLHGWKRGNEAAWSRGPGTEVRYAPTIGAALEAAIATIGDGPAVIIWGGIE